LVMAVKVIKRRDLTDSELLSEAAAAMLRNTKHTKTVLARAKYLNNLSKSIKGKEPVHTGEGLFIDMRIRGADMHVVGVKLGMPDQDKGIMSPGELWTVIVRHDWGIVLKEKSR